MTPSGEFLPVLKVPVDGRLQAFLELRLRLEPELLPCLRGIEHSPWLTRRKPQTLAWILLALYITLNNAVALFGDEIRDLLGIWSR